MRPRQEFHDGDILEVAALQTGPLARALRALDGRGEETRLVGGAVRDLVSGATVGDFDLATTALPGITMSRAREAGFHVVPTGIAHGTVTVVVEGCPIEVTTLREDVETDGRHAQVRFGRDFRADALRRDFTINALSIDSSGRLHDYCGGLDDIAAGRVRFIGDPVARIREDYLRILRFFRFTARLSPEGFDPAGVAAAIAERAGLASLSRERVRAELLKWLVAPRAPETLAEVADAGLLGPLLGGVPRSARLARLAAIEAQREEPPDALLRLAGLAVDIREDAERLRERLRLSNAEHARLDTSARGVEAHHGARAAPSLGDLRVLLMERGRQGARDIVSLMHAASGAPADDERFLSAWRFVSDTPPPRLPFTGQDLLARGLGPGERVGAALKTLQALWIRAGFPREPETLARLLDEALNPPAGGR